MMNIRARPCEDRIHFERKELCYSPSLQCRSGNVAGKVRRRMHPVFGKALRWIGLAAATAACAAAARAQAQTVADFYRGNTIRLHLSSEAGGGFDTIARIVAKYLAQYVPGRPNVIVVNMPGGGGTLMANWAYNIAPRDGSVVAMPLSTLPMNQ